MPAVKKALLGSAIACLFMVGQASASTLVYEFTDSFGSVTPDGPAPWLTAVFDDGDTAGSVSLTLTVAATVTTADIKEVYFNLNPLLDATNLSFTATGGTGPFWVSWSTGTNAYQADGDGIYDIFLQLPPPPGSQAGRFGAGETLTFNITGIGSLTVADFNYLAEIGGGAGPYYAAAKVIDTAGGGSDWIGVVPIPAAVWLFGSGLGFLGWLGKKKIAVS
jgi:hypothetical protein